MRMEVSSCMYLCVYFSYCTELNFSAYVRTHSCKCVEILYKVYLCYISEVCMSVCPSLGLFVVESFINAYGMLECWNVRMYVHKVLIVTKICKV